MRNKKFLKLILVALVGVSLYNFVSETMSDEKPPIYVRGTYQKVNLIL